MKGKKNKKEAYSPVEEWRDATEKFRNLPLKDGEYTVIIDSRTGMGLYLVAKLRNTFRSCAYMSGYDFKDAFNKVSPMEIDKRTKENEKFL